mmetsp:Transcript_14653/g.48092  ORF Transcript_14653/g.48092 Transcript_14653/m.48092 type:complete len:309 (+) Transcript_14653:718-1644(+)
MLVSPLSSLSFPSLTSARRIQWSPASSLEVTSHSTYASASGRRTLPLIGLSSVSTPSKRSSPGLKGLRSCFMMPVLPWARMLRTKGAPVRTRDSTARSLATATVSDGGWNEACDTQLASIACCASPSLAVRTVSEPTMRPTASAVLLTPVSSSDRSFISSRRFFCASLQISCARSVPLSSHTCSVCSVGLNLHRIGSNANAKPPFLSRASSSSTASPLHPKLPNTPHGCPRMSGLSRKIAPSVSCTGVGMCPPSVGEPMTNPLHRRMSSEASSASLNSQLSISTPTPALVTPRAIACASAAVLPYADA